MKIYPRELKEKAAKFCKAHSQGPCRECPLTDHSMCITDTGTLSMASSEVDFMSFARDFDTMVRIIYGDEAADE